MLTSGPIIIRPSMETLPWAFSMMIPPMLKGSSGFVVIGLETTMVVWLRGTNPPLCPGRQRGCGRGWSEQASGVQTRVYTFVRPGGAS